MELIAAEIWTKANQSIKVVNIYLPPGPENDVGIEKLWHLQLKEEDKWLIGGDTNAHHQTWEKSALLNERGEAFHEWAEENHLIVLNGGRWRSINWDQTIDQL